ncbi:5'-nucleotidase C-terminal domain-containing protein [Gallaecimonas sp. GXIMD4217]|uniref:bifunctional metallophosphatase/5'-nucleotidase n=1 Tax=Gallaecimonas sp. GXIMD4217 TaxID=3131927 RepID=UPI00311B1755
MMNKHKVAIAVALATLGLAGCDNDTSTAQPEKAQSFQLAIAHMNDTHSHIDAGSTSFYPSIEGEQKKVYAPIGGYARLKARADEIRAWAEQEQLPLLTLHGGDAFQGSLYFTQFKGAANADLLSDIGLDAMVVGNHEFDMGNEALAKFALRADFPVLASNLDLSGENNGKELPLSLIDNLHVYNNVDNVGGYIVKEINGEQVGIFGLLLQDMFEITSPDEDVAFKAEIDTARGIVAALEAQGINKIVMVSHIGLDRDQRVADAVAGIDVIVGGHSHSLLGSFENLGLGDNGQYAEMRNGACIVQAGQYAEAMGLATVTFNGEGVVESCEGNNSLLIGAAMRHKYDGENKESLTEADQAAVEAFVAEQDNIQIIEEDAAMRAKIDENYKPAIDELMGQVIATVSQDLDHVRIPGKARGGEALPDHGSNIAPLVAESMYQHTPGVDFTIVNSGGVRDHVKAGDLTVGFVAGTLLPFSNTLVSFDLKGSDVKAALEGAINNATNADGVTGTGDGSFPYTGHLRFTYDGNLPKGERIYDIDVLVGEDWVALEDDAVYKVGTTNFTAGGREGFDALLNRIEGSYVDSGYLDNQSFIDFAKAKGTLAPLAYEVVTYIPLAE